MHEGIGKIFFFLFGDAPPGGGEGEEEVERIGGDGIWGVKYSCRQYGGYITGLGSFHFSPEDLFNTLAKLGNFHLPSNIIFNK